MGKKTIVDKSEVVEVLKKFISEIIESETPHVFIASEEPFYNIYKGCISYDYSGEVRPAKLEDLDKIKLEIEVPDNSTKIYETLIEELLDSIYINQWMATYTSNYGKRWVNYFEILEDKYLDWMYENFNIYDEDLDEQNDDIEDELTMVKYSALEEINYKPYLEQIIDSIKKQEAKNERS